VSDDRRAAGGGGGGGDGDGIGSGGSSGIAPGATASTAAATPGEGYEGEDKQCAGQQKPLSAAQRIAEEQQAGEGRSAAGEPVQSGRRGAGGGNGQRGGTGSGDGQRSAGRFTGQAGAGESCGRGEAALIGDVQGFRCGGARRDGDRWRAGSEGEVADGDGLRCGGRGSPLGSAGILEGEGVRSSGKRCGGGVELETEREGGIAAQRGSGQRRAVVEQGDGSGGRGTERSNVQRGGEGDRRSGVDGGGGAVRTRASEP
jgi:hypothetical protein